MAGSPERTREKAAARRAPAWLAGAPRARGRTREAPGGTLGARSEARRFASERRASGSGEAAAVSIERYVESVQAILRAIVEEEDGALRRAAAMVARAVEGDRLVHTFGTGHSSLLASEGLYRAGGLANVDAVLEPAATFEVGGVGGGRYERLPGQAAALLDRYRVGAGDVFVVFSNSGVNALPVETAREAAGRGCDVIAVISRAYAARVAEDRPGIATLAELAHVVIDNHVPPGDALVPFSAGAAASASTVAGAFVWNAVLAQAVAELDARGATAPVYVSSNMPDAARTNAALVERFRGRVRHL